MGCTITDACLGWEATERMLYWRRNKWLRKRAGFGERLICDSEIGNGPTAGYNKGQREAWDAAAESY
jgi:hypothetical protein